MKIFHKLLKNKRLRNLVHNLALYIKYYRPYGKKTEPSVVYLIDNYKKDHGGLADRIKQIIGIYAYCESMNIKFMLVFNSPFELKKYLEPVYNWDINLSNPRNLFYSKPVYLGFISEELQERRLKIRKHQLHVYANSNYSMFIRKNNFNISNLFFELFKPNLDISNKLEFYKTKYGNWNSLVFRFQNLLQDFNEPDEVLYVNKEKIGNFDSDILKKKCLDYVNNYAEKSKSVVLVCSDSKTFLNEVNSIKNVYIIEGDITHLNFTNNKSYSIYLKQFYDFFMIMNSLNVKSVGTDYMYPTGFPKLAAEIGNVSFERVIIE